MKFSIPFRSLSAKHVPLYLRNTLTDKTEEFSLLAGRKKVLMYNCGPTVYGLQHIGNLSMFVFTDILRRTFEYNGYAVEQVINFTDVGHLTSDADEGDDKMTKGLRAEGLEPTLENMKALGKKYADLFLQDLRSLNIDTSNIKFPFASDYIAAEIAMVQTLEEKGYAYRGTGGIYYDTSRFAEYGKLGNIDIEGLKEGARVAVSEDKHHPTDFLLWKFDPELGWDSPWGKGFPGWHIECSAMINSCLGKQIDIHTGGIEHIAVHHNNEIAQSEAASGKKPLSRFWMHREHIRIGGGKIAKSEGNVVYLSDVIARGIHPIALRYLFLGAHYRSPLTFSWESLEAAQTSFIRLLAKRLAMNGTAVEPPQKWSREFQKHVNNDLDTPGALALLWEALKDASLSEAELLGIYAEADSVFGLGIANPSADLKKLAAAEFREQIAAHALPAEIRVLVEERDEAREKRNFARADELRTELTEKGYELDDSPSGTRVYRK